MKISLKVEYACRVLAGLARSRPVREWSHTDQLAAEESIPPKYLVQILSELRNGGLVESRRGKLGGYCLVRDPDQVSLLEVVRVVDRELLENRFQGEGASGPAVSRTWEGISDAFQKRLAEVTLADLVRESAGEMYYI